MSAMPRPPRPAPGKPDYFSGDTIAALTTAVGGAISMIRISGPDAFGVLGALVDGVSAESFEPRQLYRVLLKSSAGQALDDALAARFVAPHSFTGEDCVELHLHGGAFTATSVLEALAELGARQAL